MTRVLFVGVFCFAILWAWANCPKKIQPAPKPDERLKLSTPRQEYLLGEPVLFELAFRNLSKETIKIMEPVVRPNYYEAHLWRARNGENFLECCPNRTWPNFGIRFVSLKTNEGFKFYYRVVVGFRPDSDLHLSFPKAGEYRVYADFPLCYFEKGEITERIYSNVVPVRIKEPFGEDAKVWEKLKNPDFLSLLQFPRIDEESKKSLMMAELLRNHPNSAYVPTLWYALGKIYFHHRFGLTEEDQLRLAQALGITHVEAIFDGRLEARRKDQLTEETTLLKLLLLLSELGVPLDASPEVKVKKVNIGLAYNSLRLAMRKMSDDLETTWERRGDGYFLVPFQEKKGT